MNYRQKYTSGKWLKTYEKIAFDFFNNTHVDWQDASQDALIMLLETLDKLESTEHLNDKYVYAAYKNKIRDVYRRHFGRPRPPTWVKRLGVLWEKIWELFCLQQMPASQIKEFLVNSQSTALKINVSDAVTNLKKEEACPEKETVSTIDGGDDEDEKKIELPDESLEPSSENMQTELKTLLGILFSNAQEADLDLQANQIQSGWQQLSNKIDLTDDQLIILKLSFYEDYSAKEVASELSLSKRQVDYAKKQALKQIREVLETFNIAIDSLI